MPVRKAKNQKEAGELSGTFAAIRKRYGEGTVQIASSIPQPDRISTGVFVMDFALLGGIPHNRTTMFAGERHSGKTTLASLLIASAQRQYPEQTPVFLDIEGTFDATWAGKLGVNTDDLPVVTCDSGEMAVDVADAIIESQETSLVVVDSIAALTPMAEVEASAEDAQVAVQARLVSRFVRKVTAAMIRERMRDHQVTLLLLNQFRTKIGGFVMGDPRSLPGGRALEFSTTVQGIIKNKENKGKTNEGVESMTSNDHAFSLAKNKLNGGPRSGEFVLVREVEEDNDEGLREGMIDDSETVLAFAKKFGFYTGGGKSWHLEFDDYDYGFGKASEAIQALREDAELYWALRTRLIREQAARLHMPEEFIERIV